MSANKKQQIVILVGPDRCGKSEIAAALSKVTGIPSFKASSEHVTFIGSRQAREDAFLQQMRHADPRVFDLLKQTGHSVIFDRGYPCEWVYGQVLGREIDREIINHMDEMWSTLDTLIVMCCRSSYAGVVDDIDPSLNETVLQQIHDKYLDFKSGTRCRMIVVNVDDHDRSRQIREIVSAFNPGSRPFCEFCDCDQCVNGSSRDSHALTVDGRWICSTCFDYDLCTSGSFRNVDGPCDNIECVHRPKILSDWVMLDGSKGTSP